MGGNNLDVNLDRFFDTIKRGLSTLGVSEFTQKMSDIVDNNDVQHQEKKDKVDFVINIVCEKYQTNKVALFGNSLELQEARFVTWALLHYGLGLTIRRIQVIFDKKNHNSINKGIFVVKQIDLRKNRTNEARELRMIYDELLSKIIEEYKNK
jgi:chromosomal replication initiation ATPase DnaA